MKRMIPLSDTLDIVIEDPRWRDHGLKPVATLAVRAVFARLGLDPSFEVVVMGCDDARIATLNAEFRDKPVATNVLSWPAQDLAPETEGGVPDTPQLDPMGESELGDIALAYETCLVEAISADIPFEQHLTHLIVHATLHLLGYDHISDTDAALMEGLEIEILADMGQPDPYGRD
jgi:probable rRNA maturation factor